MQERSDAPRDGLPDAAAPDDGAGLDWGASPWVGPTTPPGSDSGHPRVGASGSSSGEGPTERGDRDDRARRPGRSGRRRGSAGADKDPEAGPAAPTRRRAAGTVGRRTVSQRAPRDLTRDDDAVEVARQVCLDQLSYTARTRAELATALDHRGVPAEVAAQVLDRFTEVGLIDDVAFAQAWVARRSTSKGLSGRALAQELRRRGVDDETAVGALAGLDPDDEVAAARALVERKLRTTTGLDRDTRVRRLVGMLARKGYGAGLAFRVVRDALDAEGLDPDGDVPDSE